MEVTHHVSQRIVVRQHCTDRSAEQLLASAYRALRTHGRAEKSTEDSVQDTPPSPVIPSPIQEVFPCMESCDPRCTRA